MTKVINIKNAPSGWKNDPQFVYIGRKNVTYGVEESVFHNPIIRGMKCSVCEKVHTVPGDTLNCYQVKLTEKMESVEFVRQLKLLAGKTLVCWCDPNPCHGHILAKVVDYLTPTLYYAGIGSRETPENILNIMVMVAEAFALCGYTLRSGGAGGADEAFLIGSDLQGGKKEIYLPWNKFHGKNSNQDLEFHNAQDLPNYQEARDIASHYHPRWKNLFAGPQDLMARNTYQILGMDLKTPSAFVVCWTKDGGPSGGTGQAIRIAMANKIPVYNLYNQKDLDDLFRVFK